MNPPIICISWIWCLPWNVRNYCDWLRKNNFVVPFKKAQYNADKTWVIHAYWCGNVQRLINPSLLVAQHMANEVSSSSAGYSQSNLLGLGLCWLRRAVVTYSCCSVPSLLRAWQKVLSLSDKTTYSIKMYYGGDIRGKWKVDGRGVKVLEWKRRKIGVLWAWN